MKLTPLLLLVPLAWVAGEVALPAQPAPAHAWLQSQTTDASRALTYTRFTLVGKFLTSSQDASGRPALVVDCIPDRESHASKGKYLASNLLIGTTLKIVYVEPEEIHGTSYFPKIAIRYRADDAKEVQEKWSPGTDKTSASIPKDSLKKILRARSVAINADDEHGSNLAMQFDMPDPASVEQACNVDYRRE
jgi:hypothetical protein